MEEKKYFTIKVGTCILIAIIFILIIALVGMYFYYNPKDENKIEVAQNTPGATNNKELEKDSEKVNVLKDPYENYKDLEWECNEKATKLNVGTSENYIIEDKVLYFERDGKKNKINSITDTPKYISSFTTNRISQVNVLTEEGTIWRLGRINQNDDDADSLLFDGKIDEFRKVDFKDKVINITYGDLFYINYQGYYYLLENGDLIDDRGISYDYLKGDFIESIGESIQSQIFISSDNTISYFDAEYIKIKNEKDAILKAKAIFMQYDDNYILKTFIVDENDILYYIDDFFYNVENIVAKKYNDISDEQVKTTVYDNTNKLTIIFKDNKELILEGIIDAYEKK